MKVISKEDFTNFVNGMIQDGSRKVVGVKEKGNAFAFDDLGSAGELRLDYDVTLLSPKKYFFPQRETLLRFDRTNDSAQSVVDVEPMVIIGVHPYDIVALQQMDAVFAETNADPYYMKKREAAVIIGMNAVNTSEWNFAASMGADTVSDGFDLMLTDLGGSYAVEVGSSKGENLLLTHGASRRDANGEEQAACAGYSAPAGKALDFDASAIPELLRAHYGNEAFWEEHSEKCLKCGSCVMVCPTCYCFDVKDEADLDMKGGERYRTWDGCLIEDFASVASGENFRGTKASRYRHRYNKKGQYLNERFGFTACVGCGRCSSQCLPDIADPVKVFNDLYNASDPKPQPIESTPVEITPGTELSFVPRNATVVSKAPMGTTEMLLELKLDDGSELGHQPGQFVEVSVFGIGEAPISVSSSPTSRGTFELCVRKIGNVTTKLHALEVGDKIGIRGPFGVGFDTDFFKGKNLLFIAGGLGLAPLRSFFNYVLDNRADYADVKILYGCKVPSEMLFSDEVTGWDERSDIDHRMTVDSCTEEDSWEGNVGVITTLIPGVDIDLENTYCIVVGPPIMYRFVIKSLKEKGVADDKIIVSLERRMKCGVGKCGHCQMNGIYVCQEGPVFNYADIKDVPEALE